MIFEVLLVVCYCGFGFSLWMLVCNQRTWAQRNRLINARRKFIDGHHFGTVDAMHDELEAVSYHRHMWALAFFRSPKKLYGPLSQEYLP